MSCAISNTHIHIYQIRSEVRMVSWLWCHGERCITMALVHPKRRMPHTILQTQTCEPRMTPVNRRRDVLEEIVNVTPVSHHTSSEMTWTIHEVTA